MEPQKAFATQTLLITLVGNALLLAVAYFMAGNAAIVFGVGAVLTLGVWFGIRQVGTRLIEQAATAAPPKKVEPAPERVAIPPRVEKPAQPPEASAIQMLSILQRKGRLIDFLQENIQPFDDAQIGAAVRNVHEGCRQALAEHVTLEPVMQEAEGSTVNIPTGFDAHAIRLTGNVSGDPPFNGEVRHRGWRVTRIDLPELMQKQDRIVAAAEVEVR